MKAVQYGVIGFGGIAHRRIALEGFGLDTERFSPPEAMRLTAATSRSDRRRGEAEELGLKWYDSAEALLQDASIEAVFIASNNRTHQAYAEQAIRAGKHCLIEKPIAPTMEGARAIAGLAREKGVSLSVNHMMSHNAYNQLARDELKKERIGAVNDIVLHMEFLYGSTPEEAESWRCADPDELGGPIGDVGSHCLYMAEYLLDSPIRELSCVYTPQTMPIRVENGALIEFRTERGVGGSVRVSFNAPRGGLIGTLSNLGFEIYGESGVIRSRGTLFQLSGHQDEPYRQGIEVESGEGITELKPETFPNIYRAVIENHAKSIRESKPLDGSEGLHNLACVTACHESARSGGKWRSVPMR
ncbi:MAG: gfo/Idh/MocA family oxidoreductase [Spirochaetaceae bacterium]|nr:MAG: gfo/Idh/MocA family oxidoreductase [Spirochaetaceae bacterium]